MRALLLAAVFLAAGFGICSTTRCDAVPLPYSAEVTAANIGVAGESSWTYAIRNTSTAPAYHLWLVAIEVDKQVDVVSVISPTGWYADIESQPHFITWQYPTGDIPAGQQEDGFAAMFNGQPAYQKYTAMFYNAETGETPNVEGVIYCATPEPTGIVSLLVGLVPFAALVLKRRG